MIKEPEIEYGSRPRLTRAFRVLEFEAMWWLHFGFGPAPSFPSQRAVACID